MQSYGSGFIEVGFGNGSGSNISCESGSGSRSKVLMTKNKTKNTAEIFLIKNGNLLIMKLPQRTSKLQEKVSALKREHPALQKIEFY
jgi:hypothetical protein